MSFVITNNLLVPSIKTHQSKDITTSNNINILE